MSDARLIAMAQTLNSCRLPAHGAPCLPWSAVVFLYHYLHAGLRTMLNLFLPQLRLDSQAVKLQYNEGLLLPLSGCFHV